MSEPAIVWAQRRVDLSKAQWERGWHPGDPRVVVTQYRRHILTCKRRWGSARPLVHYRGFIDSYLWAKRRIG